MPSAVCRLPSALLLTSASVASADIVVFKTGRAMSVQAYRGDGDRTTLVLRDGGEVEFPAPRLARVDPDEVPYPSPVTDDVVSAAAVATSEDVRMPGIS